MLGNVDDFVAMMGIALGRCGHRCRRSRSTSLGLCLFLRCSDTISLSDGGCLDQIDEHLRRLFDEFFITAPCMQSLLTILHVLLSLPLHYLLESLKHIRSLTPVAQWAAC